MTSVTARRIPKRLNRVKHTCSPLIYRGYLLRYPLVGCGLAILREKNCRRLLTSPVVRVLSNEEGDVLYVETENSLYRIYIHKLDSTSL